MWGESFQSGRPGRAGCARAALGGLAYRRPRLPELAQVGGIPAPTCLLGSLPLCSRLPGSMPPAALLAVSLKGAAWLQANAAARANARVAALCGSEEAIEGCGQDLLPFTQPSFKPTTPPEDAAFAG